MKKVLLVQSSRHLRTWGGAPAVAAWMLEALKGSHDITVLTGTPVDVDALNRFYGTSLKASDFQVILPPWLSRTLVKLDPHRYSIQEFCLLMRICKKIKDDYDVLVSATHEVDFGRPGIQYIHYPWCAHLYREWEALTRVTGAAQRWHRIKYHTHPWWRISRFNFTRMKQNLTLVNSNWTGVHYRDVYDMKTTTVYPPVSGKFPDVPWEKRENGFVCTGRISSEKRLEELIAMLAAVRKRGADVHFHVVGTQSGERQYYRHIRRLVENNRPWVTLHENLSRTDLLNLIATHRYGLHGRRDEHFGIAVAELLRGGCIVFAPDSGGQVEIIGAEDRLRYQTDDEAVAKILSVLENSDIQSELRANLEKRKEMFTANEFMRRFRVLVDRF